MEDSKSGSQEESVLISVTYLTSSLVLGPERVLSILFLSLYPTTCSLSSF